MGESEIEGSLIGSLFKDLDRVGVFQDIGLLFMALPKFSK